LSTIGSKYIYVRGGSPVSVLIMLAVGDSIPGRYEDYFIHYSIETGSPRPLSKGGRGDCRGGQADANHNLPSVTEGYGSQESQRYKDTRIMVG
jgi:hypothetical protein